jgi:pyruvate/2-oxoglutarate dehydrogenase complex dihydrolipoamide dehydrogenase (E3) component
MKTGTCGLTEDAAVAKYGADNLKIYTSTFVNLWYGSYFAGAAGAKPMTKYKLICLLPDEKVIGLHCIGKSLNACIVYWLHHASQNITTNDKFTSTNITSINSSPF